MRPLTETRVSAAAAGAAAEAMTEEREGGDRLSGVVGVVDARLDLGFAANAAADGAASRGALLATTDATIVLLLLLLLLLRLLLLRLHLQPRMSRREKKEKKKNERVSRRASGGEKWPPAQTTRPPALSVFLFGNNRLGNHAPINPLHALQERRRRFSREAQRLCGLQEKVRIGEKGTLMPAERGVG